MREIKFRGKRIDNGEWIFGYYGYKELTDEHFIIVPTFDAYSDKRPQYFTDHLVTLETVGQYTGLKDKNGKEIYEGDIIKSVIYETIGEKYVIDDIMRFHYDAVDLLLHEDDLEVIGNIYEHHEIT